VLPARPPCDLHPPVTEKERAVAWVKSDPFGVEFAAAIFSAGRLSAAGTAVGTDPSPYRLDYALDTDDGFITSQLAVTTRGEGWRRTLELSRSPAGEWSAEGAALPALPGALDCDLGLCPLTNTMPVLRHGLLAGGESVDLLMAWVSVPDLTVHASAQRYTALGGGRVRFESDDGSFTADIQFDADGLVVDYPGIARRLTGPSA
jgi:uncharacterized protein